jgi:hypothetical protein
VLGAYGDSVPETLRRQERGHGALAFDQGVRNQRGAVDYRAEAPGLDAFLAEQLDEPLLDRFGRVFRCREHLTHGESPSFVLDED